MPLGKTTANYGADVIYLFLGGFVLALAIQRWGLDRRIAFQALEVGGHAAGGDRRRDHGRDRVRQHVGVEHGDRRDDGADRAVDRRSVALAGGPAGRSPSTAAFRRTTSTTATSRCRCCSASPTRRRSAGWARSSARRPTASSSASSSRPTASRSRSRSGCWSGFPTMLLFLPLAWLLNTRVLFPTRIREIEGGRAWVADEIAQARTAQSRRARDDGRVRRHGVLLGLPAAADRHRGGRHRAARQSLGRRSSRSPRRSRCSSSRSIARRASSSATGTPRSSCRGGC